MAQQYLVPMLNKPNYDIFHLSASKDLGDYYEVYANAQTKVYVTKSDVEFISFEELLKQSLCISSNRVYHHKDTLSLAFNPECDPIVVSVDGDRMLYSLSFI